MPIPDFQELNAKIQDAGADWVAGETPYSRFYGEGNQTTILGLALSPEEAFSELQAARNNEISMMAGPPPTLPSSIDWRNHSGNWLTSVKDQGSCGSCVAFATVAVMESRALIKAGRSGANYDLSEAHLFYCGVSNACALGWQPKLALDFARSNGIGEEAAFPYTPGNQACRKIPSVIKALNPSSAATSIARKTALQDGPVIAAFAVYEDFFNYKSGIYRHVAGSLAGYHAVCIVGYDDTIGCWIAKNSWTTFWGNQGYFNIRYGECGLDTQFPFDFPQDVDLLGNVIS